MTSNKCHTYSEQDKQDFILALNDVKSGVKILNKLIDSKCSGDLVLAEELFVELEKNQNALTNMNLLTMKAKLFEKLDNNKATNLHVDILNKPSKVDSHTLSSFRYVYQLGRYEELSKFCLSTYHKIKI